MKDEVEFIDLKLPEKEFPEPQKEEPSF